MQQKDLLAAESATSLLRASVNEKHYAHGDTAKRLARQLRDRARMVREAVDTVRRWAPHNQRVNQVVTESSRLVDEAERQADRLDEQGKYTGQIRSQMSPDEKAAFVKKYGQAKFLKLPW